MRKERNRAEILEMPPFVCSQFRRQDIPSKYDKTCNIKIKGRRISVHFYFDFNLFLSNDSERNDFSSGEGKHDEPKMNMRNDDALSKTVVLLGDKRSIVQPIRVLVWLKLVRRQSRLEL